MTLLGMFATEQYEQMMQEDRAVEWATVWLFLMAAIALFRKALSERRVFDGLVAAFCLFVAGEEFSWGQRLLGYYPPEFFLANNFQQEANLHNLPQSFVQPKWILMTALAGYGIVLPLLDRSSATRAYLNRFGATPAPLALLPWFSAACVLLVWYPLTFTGEWVEALAGGLFLISAGVSVPAGYALLASAVGLAFAMTSVSGSLERGRDIQRTACASEEVSALARDITAGSAATDALWRMRRVHKRVWSAIQEGYLRGNDLHTFNRLTCDQSAALRHKYGIDPWGSPYWVEMERTRRDGTHVSVYSFGPNRRRDAEHGDDVRAKQQR